MKPFRTHPRVILHVDMDAFYAAVEVRENPALAGLPLIVGYKGRRGVVTTCSYEARKFGVRSAMPSVTAMRLCPEAVWVPGHMDLYVSISRRVRRILDDFSPLVEPLSIDEAFLDLTGIAADLASGALTARAIKDRITDEERLTASVGVAPTKFLAKLGSDLEKPDGLVVFPLEHVKSRLLPLPVERLWGIGPKSAARLNGAGMRTIEDLVRAGERRVAAAIGKAGAAHVLALARGEDPRRVVPDREARSISEERTFAVDLRDPEEIEAVLLERAEGVARSLRRDRLEARTIQINVRTGDFETFTRAATIPAATALAEEIFAAARELWRTKIHLGRKGVRLLGVGVHNLVAEGSAQKELFTDGARDRAHRAARAADTLSERFGDGIVTRARLVSGRRKSRKGPAPASSLPAID